MTTSSMPLQAEVTPLADANEITRKVRGFVYENFLYMNPEFVLANEDRLLEKGIVDSMGIAELISFVESEFAFGVAEQEISEANFGSLDALSRFVVRKLTL